ncbi:MAG: type II secretion system protein [Oscillospiraceae bacterium]
MQPNTPQGHTKSRLFKGFTILELMVVMAIIGILAALLIPRLVSFITNAVSFSKQTMPQKPSIRLPTHYATTWQQHSRGRSEHLNNGCFRRNC